MRMVGKTLRLRKQKDVKKGEGTAEMAMPEFKPVTSDGSPAAHASRLSPKSSSRSRL